MLTFINNNELMVNLSKSILIFFVKKKNKDIETNLMIFNANLLLQSLKSCKLH